MVLGNTKYTETKEDEIESKLYGNVVVCMCHSYLENLSSGRIR